MNTTTQVTTTFPNIFEAQKSEVLKRSNEVKAEILEAKQISDLNNWRFTDYLPKSKSINDFQNLADLQSYLVKRIDKSSEKKIASKLSHLLEVEQANDFTYFNISVEWKKSSMWGSNPRGDGYDYNGIYGSGSIGGCGYDKLSTAVANVLNQSLALKKAMYLLKEKNIDKPLRELFGYGSGYEILPYFEGGVGVSCYPRIFETIGFNFRQTGNGKMYDSFEVTKSV